MWPREDKKTVHQLIHITDILGKWDIKKMNEKEKQKSINNQRVYFIK